MVHVPRKHVLVDALASLPVEQRERIARSETRLIEFLDRRLRGGPAVADGDRPAP
ncbi:hypothetical protein [Streptomyces venezuelae]|uniref:hypothetical protein n=1 Tax=Streptomyces venezuelae TaxID=54571 RepID=UPI00332AC0AB